MNNYFAKVKKNFGFGCMRLPMKDNEVDTAEFSAMIDTFLENGFNYFDTAQGYLEGKSELALKECLTSRYPRESYILTDKLSPHLFKSEADIRPAFERQLEACGVEYFDFYLCHAMNMTRHDEAIKYHLYDFVQRMKKEGKIRYVGFSFHDDARALEKIIKALPWDFAQIQYNYLQFK